MAGENILQTLQKLMAVADRVEVLSLELREMRTTVATRLDRMDAQLSDLRERVARLETSRPADVAELKAEIAKFETNLERMMLQQEREKLEREQIASAKRLPRGKKDGTASD